MTTIKANSHRIELSNPDKVIFPDAGITKKGLVEYYQKISSHILPFLEDRPMMLHRYPNGIGDKDFYQKETPDYFPGWIKTIGVRVKGEGDNQHLVNCDSEATLVYLANQACITPHVWLSKKQDLDRPDRMIFDLDPPEGNFDLVRSGAKDMKRLFDDLGITAFAMTTGSKGIHVVVPLDGKARFGTVRDFAKKVATVLANDHPDKYTTETLKEKRKGRLFLDYLRNSYGQTAVAPYSLRARKNAPVATPLSWDEVGRSELTARSYHIGNIFRRLGAKQDPWADFYKHAISLKKVAKKLDAPDEKD